MNLALKIQVHADETKSSLQFASRALRVQNCAHVNEVMPSNANLFLVVTFYRFQMFYAISL